VSACIEGSSTLRAVLDVVARRDRRLRDQVKIALSVFDEHNTPEAHQAIDEAIQTQPGHELPLFRVLSAATREASLRPAKAGVIVFNLTSKRIIQLQNGYADIGEMIGARSRLERAGWTLSP
jgi:hypothetical protein